uniref:Uncharacterized protein n=1 Tax=Rangifer tarandus platyrhynchus TaxID=3082113 RepID=A0ACB0E8B8_RANTA|nr:unnamed protein product [Rangifer tarandus platyrhynchus]
MESSARRAARRARHAELLLPEDSALARALVGFVVPRGLGTSTARVGRGMGGFHSREAGVPTAETGCGVCDALCRG